jgi:hypothetical protein
MHGDHWIADSGLLVVQIQLQITTPYAQIMLRQARFALRGGAGCISECHIAHVEERMAGYAGRGGLCMAGAAASCGSAPFLRGHLLVAWGVDVGWHQQSVTDAYGGNHTAMARHVRTSVIGRHLHRSTQLPIIFVM